MASWHCHPESFCASGKFLRVARDIALGSFRIVWKLQSRIGLNDNFTRKMKWREDPILGFMITSSRRKFQSSLRWNKSYGLFHNALHRMNAWTTGHKDQLVSSFPSYPALQTLSGTDNNLSLAHQSLLLEYCSLLNSVACSVITNSPKNLDMKPSKKMS